MEAKGNFGKYQNLEDEFELAGDQIIFIQILSEQNLQAKKLLACLYRGVIQKAFLSEQELLTQFKSDMEDRIITNDTALKDICEMLPAIISRNNSRSSFHNCDNFESFFQFFRLNQSFLSENRNENKQCIPLHQSFDDKTLGTDNISLTHNRSDMTTHQDLSDQIMGNCSAYLAVESCEQTLKDQILDADDPNGSPNATYEQDFIILNDEISVTEDPRAVPDGNYSNELNQNLSAFFFDDNEEAVPEEISAVSLKSIDDGVKELDKSPLKYLPVDQDREYELIDITSNCEEENSIFKKPIIPKSRDVLEAHPPVFKRFMASPKGKTCKQVAKSQQIIHIIPNQSESPPKKSNSFKSFESPKRSYPFESNHDFHPKIVTSSPKIFPSFQSPKIVFRRDSTLSPVFSKTVTEIPSPNLNPTNIMRSNHSNLELNFGIKHLKQSSNARSEDVEERKTSFFDFKSAGQISKQVSGFELNYNSYGTKKSFEDIFVEKIVESKADAVNLSFLKESDLSVEEEGASDSFFQMNWK